MNPSSSSSSSRRAVEFAVFAKDRRVTVSDGTEIAYTVVGAGGDGIPVVFVNGWTCPDSYWAGIGPRVVDAGHPAVFVDTRGHGQSGLPRPAGCAGRNLRDTDVAPERLARDLVEVLDDAGLDTAAFVGHSMGVQVIFELLRVAPDRVAALAPVAGTFENPVRTFADLPILDRLYPIADVLFRALPFELLRPVVARVATPEVGFRLIKAIHVAGPNVTVEHVAPHIGQFADINFSVLWRMMSALRLHSTAELLASSDVPVIVFAGRRDLFTPPSVQEKMAELIEDVEIVWFDDGGHMLPVEEPEAIADTLVDFLHRRVDTGEDEAPSHTA